MKYLAQIFSNYFLICCGTIALLITSCTQNPSVSLRISLKKSDIYRYKISIQQIIHTMGLRMKQDVQFFQTLKVQENFHDTAYRITSHIDRMVLRQFLPGVDSAKSLLFDSDNPDTSAFRFNLLSTTSKELINKSFDMYINYRGSIIKSDFGKILEEIIPTRKDIMPSLNNRMARDEKFEQFVAILPKDPVAEGSRYKEKRLTKLGTFYPLSTTTEYHVKKILPQEVVLDYKTEFFNADSAQVPFVFSGSNIGSIRLDRSSLLAIENSYTQKVTMDLNIFGFPTTVSVLSNILVSRIP
ncbi:MAG: DUF6263 family protein [Flavobacteriales bacterium]|nr:DUF6263 family protein [Flavobacteriales bacterium]MDW8432929.1 DUF6263 family protein [Flavobacteriales bacterium]